MTTFFSQLSDCENTLVDVLCRRTGVRLQEHQLPAFRSALAEATLIFNKASCRELVDVFTASLSTSQYWDWFVEKITVGESYFFRDENQVEFLRDYWFPELIAGKRSRGEKQLRIWSAGASSGQELYTLSIIIHDLLPDIAQWDVLLLGTDISVHRLSTAREAVYNNWSVRTLSERKKSLYFETLGRNQFRLRSPYRENVCFSYLNLFEDEYPSLFSNTVAMDLILCRHVLIYFDPGYIKGVVQRFAQALKPEGCLLLGASDPLDAANDVLYAKQVKDVSYFENREKKENQVPLGSHLLNCQPVKSAIDDVADLKNQLIHALGHEQWQYALELSSLGEETFPGDVDFISHKAKALANLGQLEESLRYCQKVTQSEPQNHHSFYLAGLIFEDMGKPCEAELAFKQVLTLKEDFFEAYYRLAILMMGRKEYVLARGYLQKCLTVVKELHPQRLVHSGSDLNLGRFKTIVLNEIESLDLRSFSRNEN